MQRLLLAGLSDKGKLLKGAEGEVARCRLTGFMLPRICMVLSGNGPAAAVT